VDPEFRRHIVTDVWDKAPSTVQGRVPGQGSWDQGHLSRSRHCSPH